LNTIIGEKKGFSLVEVVIGLIFLAIGLLAVAGMQVASVRGNFSSNNVTQATYIAQDRLEFLKNLPFGSTELAAGSHPDGTITNSAKGYKGLVFNRAYVVTDAPSPSRRKTINYSVSWNDGVDHIVTFSTIRSD